ncbi:MAG: 5'/3'-nucleotidase SurE [Brevinema sp.]
MKILFTNDDGYDAIGIQTLYNEFRDYYDSYMCAPLNHKSAFSHAINFSDHLEVKKLTDGVKGFALDGTPADCSRAALQGLFTESFDLVLSGINYGENAGHDVFYSGTVGAAREATFHGIMAIALSLDLFDNEGQIVSDDIPALFAYAAKITRKIVDCMPRELLHYKGSIININFPSIMPAKGIKLTTLGVHEYKTELYHSSQDDKDYVRIDTVAKNAGSQEGTDVRCLEDGYIVVTALHKGVMYDDLLQSQLEFVTEISVTD